MNLFVDEARQHNFSYPLHALRGAAAVIVLLSHIHMRIKEAYGDWALPPIFNGSGAVIFFFVLSGLVVGTALAKQELTLDRACFFVDYRSHRKNELNGIRLGEQLHTGKRQLQSYSP